ncbi:NAD-dependent epimerase/dehydratase family protein [Alicyclobacillus macrosporangiidus]|nr:NAD-dependent epimerase/dehydratase family protein [Alicyclobacillus macrosporangiidus]
MGTALVTGCAGFIGSHLCERLLDEGERVIGVDVFTANYPRWIKQRNLAAVAGRPGFTLLEQSLLEADLRPLLQQVDVVYHQAALPGVRTSWGQSFGDYVSHNILATQRLLEAAREVPVRRLVCASSSSVYGGMTGPVGEDGPLRPISPYGVTKLSAEQLCQLYALQFGLSVVCLRYFTVFGPRQRPDMAIHRFIRAVLHRQPLTVYGDGEQTRDFTLIHDAVTANLLAAQAPGARGVYNIGYGGSCFPKDVRALIRLGQEHGLVLDLLQKVEQVNQTQVEWCMSKFAGRLGGLSGRRIALLGLTFKPHTDDIREAPSLRVIQMLLQEGALVSAFDPKGATHVQSLYPAVRCAATPYEAAAGADAVLLLTEWPQIIGLDWQALRQVVQGNVLLDARNALQPEAIRRAGFQYMGVGRGVAEDGGGGMGHERRGALCRPGNPATAFLVFAAKDTAACGKPAGA